MTPSQVILIAVPPEAWTTVPGDRPLADLAADALGSARRILKGSNARRERLRYARLTGYVGAVALELSRRGNNACTLRLRAEHADGYLDLVELLGRRTGEDGSESLALPAHGRVRSFAAWVWAVASNLHRAWLAFLPLPRARQAAASIRFAWRDFRSACADARTPGLAEAALPTVGSGLYPPGQAVADQRRLFDRLTPGAIDRMFAEIPQERRAVFAAVAAEKADFLRAAEASGAAVVEVVASSPE